MDSLFYTNGKKVSFSMRKKIIEDNNETAFTKLVRYDPGRKQLLGWCRKDAEQKQFTNGLISSKT